MIAQGEVWWADLDALRGSEPGFRRSAIVVQSDAFDRSRISTVVCIAVTSNIKWADAPGDVLLEPKVSGLDRRSVANVSQIVTVDRSMLVERIGRLPAAKFQLVLDGIDLVLGR